jgi:hypothetical protein
MAIACSLFSVLLEQFSVEMRHELKSTITILLVFFSFPLQRLNPKLLYPSISCFPNKIFLAKTQSAKDAKSIFRKSRDLSISLRSWHFASLRDAFFVLGCDLAAQVLCGSNSMRFRHKERKEHKEKSKIGSRRIE